MEFFKHNTKIDFMGIRKWTAIISAVVFILSISAVMINGLNFGLDFTGGMQIEVVYAKPANLAEIRGQLQRAGLGEAVVQGYGPSEDVLITLRKQEHLKQDQIVEQVLSALPGAEKRRVDFIGPQIGKELATKGALAMIISVLGTMIYIAMRFEYRFAVSSALALIHDPMLILGIFAIFHIEFNLPALAALLAVIGYSLNDTIVVFDRVRENFRKVRKGTPIEIMNLSINQTLSRTIMTSALTLVTVVILFFLGGEMIHSFSVAMIIGIVVGTYSSIYVAGALALAMGLDRKDFIPVVVRESDIKP
ncbi:protein translocase subunit SecF [soil metagenome]